MLISILYILFKIFILFFLMLKLSLVTILLNNLILFAIKIKDNKLLGGDSYNNNKKIKKLLKAKKIS